MATRTKPRRAADGPGRRRGHKASVPAFLELQSHMLPVPPGHGTGALIIIGGHEDKNGDKEILREVSARVRNGKLVVATIATSEPDEVWNEYRGIFRELGVGGVAHLHIESRADAFAEAKLSVLDGAGAVFFTGGDQLRITSRIGGAPICDRIRDIFTKGGVIAGTSAGASAASETMLVSGAGDESHRTESLQMAPGLGFLR